MSDPAVLHPSANVATQSYALLTDAPPLKEGGHGCNVLAWNWIQAMREQVRIVITRRLNASVIPNRVRADLPVPVSFYPDTSRVPLARRSLLVQSLFEAGLFRLWLPHLAARVRASGAHRVFAFFGGDACFLQIADQLARRARLPLDIYLVDDLEASARLRSRWLARLTRWLEPKVLHSAQRVFAISPGYSEHLNAKYGVQARWLPISFPTEKIVYSPFRPGTPDVRELVFLGAVNVLYLEALRDLLQAIHHWNESAHSYKLRLVLLTYASPDWVKTLLGDTPALEILYRRPVAERLERLAKSWAVFLPYSFEPEQRLMVSTSFSTKLTESLTSGRPVLVYGPEYASLPRYFIENHLPICVTSKTRLGAALQDIERYDSAAITERYQAVIQKYHSPVQLKQLLDVGYEKISNAR